MRAIALGCFARSLRHRGPRVRAVERVPERQPAGPGGAGRRRRQGGRQFQRRVQAAQQPGVLLPRHGRPRRRERGVHQVEQGQEPEPAPAPAPAADPAAVADPAAAPAEAAPAPAPAPSPSLALQVPGPDGDEVCVSGDKAMIEQIAAAPADYYVEIVTPGHPKGRCAAR